MIIVLVIILLIGLINSNVYAVGMKIESGFAITENNINQMAKKLNISLDELLIIFESLGMPLDNNYILESQDIINIANEMKGLEEDNKTKDIIIAEQDKLIEGQQKEIQMQRELIIKLEDKVDYMKITHEEYKKRTEESLSLANELLQIEREKNSNLTQQNRELEKQATLSILDQLKYAGMGIILYKAATN